jgi:predicted nuclease of predicted toxin-antitoxin system
MDAAHPLAGLLARQQERPGVRQLRLGNLPATDLGAMVAETLHVDQASAEASPR